MAAVFDQTQFSVLQVNIRGIIKNLAELSARLRLVTMMPDVLCLNETWLDRTTKHLDIEGYECVARRDRRGGMCGGIATFARSSIAQQVTLLHTSEVAERHWMMVHAQQGPILLCNWYRPPGEHDSLGSFEHEWGMLKNHALGTICVGDLNIHHKSWLHHSNRDSPEGREFQEVCARCHLRQVVRHPTREEYLLDLVLTDQQNITVEVLPEIADHRLVSAKMTLRVPVVETRSRTVWNFRQADWRQLEIDLEGTDWEALCSSADVDTCVNGIFDSVMSCAESSIPRRQLTERKSTHEWLTPEVTQAVARKKDAAGTASAKSEAEECSRIILKAFGEFVQRSRQELQEEKRGSKKWWRKARRLAHMSAPFHSVPALKGPDGWVKDAKGKADLLKDTMTSKFIVPPIEANEFSCLHHRRAEKADIVISEDLALSVLGGLRTDSATGPDGLPTRILKWAASSLARPLTLLTRKILEQGKWPDAWREHWIVALHKRASVYDAKNYRGVHLTPQISKAVERIIANLLQPYLVPLDIFGENQFAYTKQRGARDAIAFLVMTWIWSFEQKEKVGVFCSDVQGAFDRVRADRLGEKLHASGIPSPLVAVLVSWLEARRAHVVVEGETSVTAILQDMVYQGTVLGPPLWNLFFKDARVAVEAAGFRDVIYADDLNAFRAFDAATENDEILAECSKCQSTLHRWGVANAVTFDPGKESMHILSRWEPAGGDFKILGILFDPKLRMEPCIDSLCTEASCRMDVILRTQRFHTAAELIHLYKAQVLSFMEYRTPAVYHACSTLLGKVDRLQRRFLRALGVSDEYALSEYALAPLASRRDMAMLGVIHRCNLGFGPAHFKKFFRRREHTERRFVTRSESRRHRWQLEDPRDGSHSELLARSIFGLIGVYNLLPSRIVEEQSVQSFQRALQCVFKEQAAVFLDGWTVLFSPRQPMYSHPLRILN